MSRKRTLFVAAGGFSPADLNVLAQEYVLEPYLDLCSQELTEDETKFIAKVLGRPIPDLDGLEDVLDEFVRADLADSAEWFSHKASALLPKSTDLTFCLMAWEEIKPFLNSEDDDIVMRYLFGSLYGADDLPPSHLQHRLSQSIHAEWQDLGPNLQGLILGLLKGLGSGALIAGAAVLCMTVVSIRTSAQPFRILLPLVPVGYSALLCYATYSVYVSTPAKPPLLLNLVLVASSLIASSMLLIQTPAKQREE